MKELLISGVIIACCFGCYKKEEPKEHEKDHDLNQSEAVAPVGETIVHESQLAENADAPEQITTLPVVEEEKDAISEEVIDNPSTLVE